MVQFQVTRDVDKPRDLVFAVIADVARYREFVPGFSDAKVRRIGERKLEVMQRVGIKALTVAFRSIAEFDPPERIVIRSHDRPFDHLHQEWHLEDIGSGRTRVTLSTRYALTSGKLQRLVGGRIDRQLRQTIEAFEARLAQDLSSDAP